jgi:hypothetical protein
VIQLDQKTKKNDITLVRLLLVLPEVRFIPVARHIVSVGRNIMQESLVYFSHILMT